MTTSKTPPSATSAVAAASREDWQAAMVLLDTALVMPPESVGEWLDALEPPQARLSPLLRKLLAAHARLDSGDFMGPLPADAFLGGESAPELRPGTLIGPYRLQRELGRGGMAAVWLAARADGSLSRQVALKIPLPSRQRSDLAERFRRERDILARLQHAHIARLYDAGVADDGTPYLALEYVEGLALTTYCDRHRLGIDARLVLFAQVLQAVQYAHASLVIHRDLKPANILVTPQGEVRLLDFGIARLLAGDDSPPTSDLTQASGLALTPEYASPEQIRGESLTIATDTYSLGVVLHELLCGHRPYRLKAASAAQLEAAVLEVEPLRPSANLDEAAAAARNGTPRRLARALAGDLDTITAKAMKKLPAARYASAAAFADDLLRHRLGRPVLAQPDSLAYRATKFVRRYRFETAGALLSVAALITVTVVAVVQARHSTLEARKAQAVKGFLLEILTAADPAVAQEGAPMEMTMQKLLDEADRRVASDFTDQPDVKSEVLLTLALAYESMALYEQSLNSVQAALALPHGSDRSALEQRVKLTVLSASVLSNLGRLDAAIAALDEADQFFSRLGDSDSLSYAQALELRGSSHFRRGIDTAFQAQAYSLLERSHELYRTRYPDAKGHATVLKALSELYGSEGRHEANVRLGDEMVALAEARPASRPLELANAYHQRGSARRMAGELDRAVLDFAAASRLYLSVVGRDHMATLRNNLHHGSALLHTRRAEPGLALLRAVLEASRSDSRLGPRWEAVATQWLGLELLWYGRFEEAEAPLVQARSMLAALSPEMRLADLRRSESTLGLAEVRRHQGRYDDAQRLLEEALAVRRKEQHRHYWPLAEVHGQLGLLALHRDRLDEARTHFNTALAQAVPVFLSGLSVRAQAQAGLAEIALQAGDGAAAQGSSLAALQTANEPLLREESAIRAATFAARGRVLCRFGDASEGRTLLSQAITMRAAHAIATDPDLAGYRMALGRCSADSRR